MPFLWLKFIHVISSTVLLGTGLGTAFTFLMAHKTRDPYIIAAATRYVVLADWLFTASSGVVQPVTGFWMVYVGGLSFTAPWILGSIIGYFIAACCWFIVVYLQIQMRNMAMAAHHSKTPLPDLYFRYFNYWFLLGWPAFLSLIIVFYLMTNKPGF